MVEAMVVVVVVAAAAAATEVATGIHPEVNPPGGKQSTTLPMVLRLQFQDHRVFLKHSILEAPSDFVTCLQSTHWNSQFLRLITLTTSQFRFSSTIDTRAFFLVLAFNAGSVAILPNSNTVDGHKAKTP